MRTPDDDRDLTPAAIARALVIFAAVLATGVLVVVVASSLGADALEPGVVVAAAVAALLSVLLVVRHRHD